jgi:hypothetical protein
MGVLRWFKLLWFLRLSESFICLRHLLPSWSDELKFFLGTFAGRRNCYLLFLLDTLKQVWTTFLPKLCGRSLVSVFSKMSMSGAVSVTKWFFTVFLYTPIRRLIMTRTWLYILVWHIWTGLTSVGRRHGWVTFTFWLWTVLLNAFEI